MRVDENRAAGELLGLRAYAELKAWLKICDRSSLLRDWGAFPPVNQLVLFKLMDPQSAQVFYTRLGMRDRYLILCGFALSSIAPVLERLSAEEKGLFVSLPQKAYDRMFRQLVTERVELKLSLRFN